MPKVYRVIENDRDGNIYGIYDSEGLKKFIKEMKKHSIWRNLYTSDDTGKRKFCKRQLLNPMWYKYRVVSHTLNKQDYGLMIDWWKHR